MRGEVGRLRAPLEEWNRKEDAILFYLEKHLRYAEAFAREELRAAPQRMPWKATPRLFGTPDERMLWLKRRYYRMPLYVRPSLYFFYRYFVLLGHPRWQQRLPLPLPAGLLVPAGRRRAAGGAAAAGRAQTGGAGPR